MLALSVQQPWAWAILHMAKDIENRSWWPPRRLYGQDIMIHAGQRLDRGGLDSVEAICGVRPVPCPQGPRARLQPSFDIMDARDRATPGMELGCLLGVVRLVGAHHIGASDAKNRWACGPVCFVMKDPRPWPEPIPCRGQLGFWEPVEESFHTAEDYYRYLKVRAELVAV